MKIGILKEGKVSAEKRVPFTPAQCKLIEESFSGTKVFVQKSDTRSYSNEFLCLITFYISWKRL